MIKEQIIEIIQNMSECIEENTYDFMVVDEDENGTWHGEVRTLTEDGLLALERLIDDLYSLVEKSNI